MIRKEGERVNENDGICEINEHKTKTNKKILISAKYANKNVLTPSPQNIHSCHMIFGRAQFLVPINKLNLHTLFGTGWSRLCMCQLRQLYRASILPMCVYEYNSLIYSPMRNSK